MFLRRPNRATSAGYNAHERAHYKRRVIIIAVIAVVVYSCVWYFASQFVQNTVLKTLTNTQSEHASIQCEKMHKAGYPLRVGVACESFSFYSFSNDITVAAAKLSASAPIYALTWAELSLSSPAALDMPGLPHLKADWREMKLASSINKPVPDEISLLTDQIIITAQSQTENEKTLLSADFIRFEAKGLNGNLSTHLVFDKLFLPKASPREDVALPEIDGNIRLTLQNSAKLFATADNVTINNILHRLRGYDGFIDQANISLKSGGKFKLSGPFSIDADGLINAKFDLSISEQPSLMRSARTLFPSQAQNMEAIFFAINSMPKNEDGDPVFKITIKRGEARLGFIKLGRIAPI